MASSSRGQLSGLRTGIAGELIVPDDSDYESAATPWNLSFRHRPALIVKARTIDDVVTAVNHARRHGLTVTVQATGHGVTSAATDGVLILTSQLNDVVIDPEEATATIGGGATWAPVLAKAQEFGLAPLLGSSPHTGAVGYTLGGGFGWLARRHGLAADHVRSFRVVLADGSIAVATSESEPDLFWALRGAGMGSLGVVVEMEIGLVPVSTVYGGNLLYPIDDAGEVFEFYSAWSEDLPFEFTTAFDVFRFPPLEVVAEPLRGRAFAIVRGCHCGDLEEGTALVDRVRAWRSPELDLFESMSFRDVGMISQDPVEPLAALTSARWLTGLGDDVIAEMCDVVIGTDGVSPFLFAEIRHGGGAMSRIRPEASYSPPETADRLLQVVAITPEADLRERAVDRVQALWANLASRVDSVFLNLNEGDERVDHSRNAFDFATWDRLAAVASRVDPDHVFAHGIDLRTDQQHGLVTSRKGDKE